MATVPTTYIGLLRAINLGSYNKVSMAALRDLLQTLGLEEPRTLLQSGNVVFGSRRGTASALETRLSDAVANELGVRTDFFVRTADEWRRIVANNPFPREATESPGFLLLMSLKTAPPPAAVAALQKAITGGETVRVIDREAYLTYPEGIGRSKLTNVLIEKHLGTRGTARNWNTVLKLAGLTA